MATPTTTLSYRQRRGKIETYFDRTAVDAWAKLTSDAPVGRIRATVRAGRDRMRQTLLGYLPSNLRGKRLLDAGCGTGALAVEAARRGAAVVAVDLSPNLIRLARERLDKAVGTNGGTIEFMVGDLLDAGRRAQPFDYVVAMDSLIHYRAADAVQAIAGLVQQASDKVVFTFAPKTVPLAMMHAVGRLFPHSQHRAPAIEPVADKNLRRRLAAEPALRAWQPARSERVACGFYTSQALELVRVR